MRLYKFKNVIIAAFILALILSIGLFFYFRPAPKKIAYISISKLLPNIPAAQVRATICDEAQGEIFKKICEPEFNSVSKNDTARIDQLYEALNDVKNDSRLSDYQKFLFGRLVFATLPNGKSPSAFNYRSSPWLASISAFFGMPVQAQTVQLTRAQYEEQLINDLASIMKDCPKPGDENWILTTMCDEHSWNNETKQPIYSKQYIMAGGPNWCNDAGEAGAQKIYHSHSVINTKMKDQNDFANGKNISNEIGCMFSCGSYPSAPSGFGAQAEKCEPVSEYTDLTEDGYKGTDLLKIIIDRARQKLEPDSAGTSGGEAAGNSHANCDDVAASGDGVCIGVCSDNYNNFKNTMGATADTDTHIAKYKEFMDCYANCKVTYNCVVAGANECPPVDKTGSYYVERRATPQEVADGCPNFDLGTPAKKVNPTVPNSSPNSSGQVPMVESR